MHGWKPYMVTIRLLYFPSWGVCQPTILRLFIRFNQRILQGSPDSPLPHHVCGVWVLGVATVPSEHAWAWGGGGGMLVCHVTSDKSLQSCKEEVKTKLSMASRELKGAREHVLAATRNYITQPRLS